MSYELTAYEHLIGAASMNYDTQSELAARELCSIMAARLQSSTHEVDQYFAKCLQLVADGADPAAALNLKKKKGRRRNDPSVESRICWEVNKLILLGEAATPKDAAAHLEARRGFPNMQAEQILNIYSGVDRTKKK